MSFYKQNGLDLLCAPNFVHAPGYSLMADQRATYVFPVDGWTWYDTQGEAFTAFGMTTAPHSATAITRLAFRSRFTQAEKVTIEIAQLDNAAANMSVRAGAAALRASQADLMVASYIDVARSDTIAGVNSLETAGLLATGRAAQILSTTITPLERPV